MISHSKNNWFDGFSLTGVPTIGVPDDELVDGVKDPKSRGDPVRDESYKSSWKYFPVCAIARDFPSNFPKKYKLSKGLRGVIPCALKFKVGLSDWVT